MSPTLSFEEILQSPTATYEEGLRFFRGEGLMNQTLKQLVADLEAAEIDYCIIGAVALNQHGYRRFTEDIDVLLSAQGLEQFRRDLVGRGYQEITRTKFCSTKESVPIKIVVSDTLADEQSIEIDGVRTLPLARLIELKLASGMIGEGRLKDLADVQELIRLKNLAAEFADQLAPYVREKFVELQRDLIGSFEHHEE